MIVSSASGEYYKWGGHHGVSSEGWHLVRTPDLSIIEEVMPPGTSEARHLHKSARQFFFVLEGELTMEIEKEVFLLVPGQGIEISPGLRHQAMNRGSLSMRMIVTSQPPSHGDRVLA